MNDNTKSALDIQVEPVENAFAEEWIPLVVKVQRSDFWPGGVELRNVNSKDKSVQISLDLLDREMEIQPGEAYRFTLPIRVAKRCTLSLDTIVVEIGPKGEQSELTPLPKRLLNVRPSIGNEVEVKLETICEYDEGTKVILKLRHKGITTFSDLTVNLTPENAISSGKHVIQIKRFGVGDEQSFDLVLNTQDITVDLTANVDGDRCAKTINLKVEPPTKTTETWYRFLEPCREFAGKIEIHEVDETNTPTNAVFCDQSSWWPLGGGLRYEVVIRPKLEQAVESISIREIADMIVVRSEEFVKKDGSWRFIIDVINHDLLRRSEVINYDVTMKGGKEIGEIPICLLPHPWKHLKLAAVLGATMTLQGVAAVPKFLYHADNPLHLFADFKLNEHYNLFFLLTIPAFWLGLKIVDWLNYRLHA